MITLEQAIELATEAHKDQWRKSEPIDAESFNLFLKCTKNAVFPHILSNGNKIFFLNEELVMQKSYITHPLAVMNMMDTEEEKIVAVLHDVFEDTTAELYSNNCKYSISFDNTEYQIPHQIWSALYALTKPNSDWDKFKEKGNYQSYQGYIKDITLNKTATKVKIADIVHNLSCSPSDHAKEKYLKAIPVLLKSL